MPTYVYACPRCAAKAEIIATLSQEIEAPKCSKCDELMMRKYDWQTTRFIGGGWGKDAR
jgi:putative FmdB family regulatory protein